MATILKYKNYTWPCNPETCNVTMSRPVTLNKDSAGALSQTQTATEPRQVRGEGILSANDLSAEYTALWALLQTGGAGTLVLDGLPSMRAYLTELEFIQIPYEGAMRYRFAFVEALSQTA